MGLALTGLSNTYSRSSYQVGPEKTVKNFFLSSPKNSTGDMIQQDPTWTENGRHTVMEQSLPGTSLERESDIRFALTLPIIQPLILKLSPT